MPPVLTGRNAQTGRFMKGHVPANKCKKWDEYMSKRSQKRASKGWRNLDLHRNKNGRPDTAGRCRKAVIAVTDSGAWCHFDYLGDAARWIGGNRFNVGRCCRSNQLCRQTGKKVNTDHKYLGLRFYYAAEPVWEQKIKR